MLLHEFCHTLMKQTTPKLRGFIYSLCHYSSRPHFIILLRKLSRKKHNNVVWECTYAVIIELCKMPKSELHCCLPKINKTNKAFGLYVWKCPRLFGSLAHVNAKWKRTCTELSMLKPGGDRAHITLVACPAPSQH